MSRPALTQARLKELLTYDSVTGVFRRKVATHHCVTIGEIAGCINQGGYRAIKVDNRCYLAHRLAFLYMEGAFPADMVDHINCDPSDNRWCNLRHATRSQNNANTGARKTNLLGVKGVSQLPSGRFRTEILLNGRRRYLGTFNTIEEASAAYQQAANDHHGEYARVV